MEKDCFSVEKKENFQKRIYLLSKKGFSLVEVLVTLLVLSLAISAVTFLMVGNIRNSQNAKNQIVAAHLAQEGAELIRNVKDNGKLDTSSYDDSSDGPYLGRIDMAMSNFASGGSGRLYLSSSSGFFTHSSGTGTKFFRRISLKITGNSSTSPSTRKIIVTSYVTWNGSGFVGKLADLGNCNQANKCVSSVSIIPDLY